MDEFSAPAPDRNPLSLAALFSVDDVDAHLAEHAGLGHWPPVDDQEWDFVRQRLGLLGELTQEFLAKAAANIRSAVPVTDRCSPQSWVVLLLAVLNQVAAAEAEPVAPYGHEFAEILTEVSRFPTREDANDFVAAEVARLAPNLTPETLQGTAVPFTVAQVVNSMQRAREREVETGVPVPSDRSEYIRLARSVGLGADPIQNGAVPVADVLDHAEGVVVHAALNRPAVRIDADELTPGDLAKRIGCNPETVRLKAKAAGVPGPKAGERNFRYSPEAQLKICGEIINRGGDAHMRMRALQLRGELVVAAGSSSEAP